MTQDHKNNANFEQQAYMSNEKMNEFRLELYILCIN